jgi:predicted nucleic acid-binding protein
MTRVLDAYALIAYFEREAGHEAVQEALLSSAEKDIPILMTSVNYGEVIYIVLRECGKTKAEEVEKALEALPIEIVDVDRQIAKTAAQFKAQFRLSYADCFAAALTSIKRGELLTGDREFDQLKNLIRIRWIDDNK